MSGGEGIRLFAVRHGETALNHGHRMQGWSDHPLNERGRLQARALAGRLAEEKLHAVFASDLPRAEETARILAAPHGLPVRSDERLREQDYGDWEGASWPELSDVAGEGAVDRFLSEPGFRVPGGESKAEVLARVRGFLDEIVEARGGETVLVVSHGGPIQVLVQAVLEIPWSVKKRLYPSNAGLTELTRDEGYWRLVTFDEKTHLRELP